MATQYAGGTYINVTYTADGTKQSLINQIETQLLAAGWTTVSGHNTTNLLMLTAATPYGLQNRFRFKDNAGTCVTISVENTTSTINGANTTSNGIYLIPTNLQVFRIIATQFWFLITVPGSTAARTFAFGSVLYVPSFMTGVTNSALLIGNSIADASATVPITWRTRFGQFQNNVPNFQVIYNSSLVDNGNNLQNSATTYQGAPQLVLSMAASAANVGGTYNAFVFCNQWANGDIITSDPLVAWGLTTVSDIVQVRGQLWDSIFIQDSFSADTSQSFSTYTWYNLTSNFAGSAAQDPRGSLWFRSA